MTTEWTLNIPGWTPTPLNKLLNSHWGKAAKFKKHDWAAIGHALIAAGVPAAKEKRRIDMIIIHPKGKRFCDPDAYFKSAGDALVRSGALKNDSHEWVEFSPPEFARGAKLRTIITITEL